MQATVEALFDIRLPVCRSLTPPVVACPALPPGGRISKRVFMSISISDYVHGTSTIITEVSVSEDGQILLMAGDGLAYILNPVCAIRLSNQLRYATHLALQELHDEMGGK